MLTLIKNSLHTIIVVFVLLFIFCDQEKGMLFNFRDVEMTIEFKNGVDGELIVRNTIPVEIHVLAHSKKQGVRDVTGQVDFDYSDSTLGKVYYDSLKGNFVYKQDGVEFGRQRIIAKVSYSSAVIEFTVSPVEFVSIPSGIFLMGSDFDPIREEERPVHWVEISGFEMGKYEVTNIEYLGFLRIMRDKKAIKYDDGKITDINNNRPYLDIDNSKIECVVESDSFWFSLDDKFEDLPVVGVSWYGAEAFASYYDFRLPTEAEWEYACRGLTTTEYFCGDEAACLPEYAIIKPIVGNTSEQSVHNSGRHANPFGLFDILGNVAEWCNDFYAPNYYGEPPYPDTVSNPCGPASNADWEKVVRGGHFAAIARDCRCARRKYEKIDNSSERIGFRVAINFLP